MPTRHIVIVDTEARTAFFLIRTLENLNQNCQVDVVRTREAALEMVNDDAVDLLIADLRVPSVSGLELIRQVRACSPHTRTILIATYGNNKVEEEARRLEAYRTITEPLNGVDFTWATQEGLRDAAVSRPGLAVLSDESFEAIVQQLEYLRRDVGAQYICLADMLGQRLAEVGETNRFNMATVLPLLSQGFAAASTLTLRAGDGPAAQLYFHQSTRYEIYSTNVCDNLLLALTFERQIRASRIATVWLNTRRAVKRLLTIVSTAATLPDQLADASLGSTLTTELDALLTDETFPPTFRGEDEEPDLGHEVPGKDCRTGMNGVCPVSSPEQDNGSPNRQTIQFTGEETDPAGEETEGAQLDLETAITRGLVAADEEPDGTGMFVDQVRDPLPHHTGDRV